MSSAGRCIFLLLSLCYISVFSQSQPPPGLKWQKISLRQFQVVFPRVLEDDAFRTASLMNQTALAVPDSYKVSTRKIPLYLNNQSVISNGYVALGPRHMQWYMHPPQDVTLGSGSWTKLLAVHEYRHVVQLDYFNRHITRVMSTVFGDPGLAVLYNWSVPRWFSEGDAVSAETIFTGRGRGRLPDFEMELKAILKDTGNYFSYDQAYLGSYRRYYPDVYHLGYFMHTHVARNHGLNTWPAVLNRVSKISYSPYAFSGSLKKFTRNNLTTTYTNTINELRKYWNTGEKDIASGVYPVVTNSNRVKTNYRYGHLLYDGSLLCLKYGMADPPSLVKVLPGGKQLGFAHINNIDFISSNGNLIAWNTHKTDVRWGERDYSNIVVADFKKGRKRQITHRGKFVSPSVSPGGDKIAAVRMDSQLRYSIVIMNAKNGRVLKEFAFGKTYVRTPAWSPDERHLVFTTSFDEEITLSQIDVETGDTTCLIRSETDNISKPVYWKDFVLFNSDITGKNDIHALDITNANRFIALSGGCGYFNPTVNPGGDEILVENYLPGGYQICRWKPDENTFIPYADQLPFREYYISPLLEKRENKPMAENTVSDSTGKTERYRHLLNGLKVHSWLLLPTPAQISATVQASDPLSLISVNGQILINLNEGNSFQGFNVRYAGLYPELALGTGFGKRTAYYKYSSDSTEQYQWDEKSVTASMILPFDISVGAFNQSLQLAASYDYVFKEGIEDRYVGEFDYGNGTMHIAGGSLSYLGFRQMARRDFYPRVGASLQAGYQSTLEESDFHGSLISAAGLFYLPGLWKHHSLRVNVAIEQQDPDPPDEGGYAFPSKILYFRGYDPVFHEKLLKFSADYALPLIYPDLSLGSVIYIKRIRANAFIDWGLGKHDFYQDNFLSAGMDLLFDINFFRLFRTIDLGARLAITRERDVKAGFLILQAFQL